MLQAENIPTNQRIDNAMMTATKLVENKLKKVIRSTKLEPKGENVNDLFGDDLVNKALNWGFIPKTKKQKPDPLFFLMKWYFAEPRNTSHHQFDAFPETELITYLSITNYILNEIEAIEEKIHRKIGLFTYFVSTFFTIF